MAKLIKSAESTIILLILLVSLFAVSIPVIAIPTLNSNIDVVWGEKDTVKPVIPRDEIRKLNLTIKYKVDWGGDFAYGALIAYSELGKNALINLKVTDHSPWCTANLGSDVVLTLLTTGLTQSSVFLNLQLRDDAPAFGEGYVKIRASVPIMGFIGGFEKEFTLDFVAGYLPRINANLPEGTTKNIGPLDSAVFPVEISNLGNARTTVFFKIEDIPKGWTAVINDDMTLDENGKFTATLTVKPPRGFGFHDDRQSIMVRLTPARAEDLTNIGKPSFVSVIVQSRGFSTPGFEAIGFIGALAIVMLTIFIIRKRK
ncbi:MAG: hypothetical protein IMZ58_02340 [Thermoplasmata archaeon]|nr:hypothetical protein [Thermoplasmata archaeon]